MRLLALALLLVAAPAAADPTRPLVVCYPGGTVTARQAEPAIGKLLGVLERLGGLPAGGFHPQFERDVGACRAALAARPPLAILSLGLFLEHREAHHLVPLVRPRIQGRTSEALRVLVRAGTAANLLDLKGKTLTGTPLEEPAFLTRVAFAGVVDPATHFTLKPEKRALKALRALDAGEVDAVLVTDAQYAALGALPFADKLAVVHTTDALPLVGVVADETQLDAAARARLVAALAGICADAEGKALCELFGVEAFEPVDAAAYAEAVKRWGTP
ncbi:MAG: PhnD/SsuA/transferrin family substrate-binding protein [Myxococcales bacterium]|nr:PhnD/SsuA/transferrin family substrate-binding protein [Myxococcales bacterium]